jgi:hypothetical protein
MSAIGPKRTSLGALHVSAFKGKADIDAVTAWRVAAGWTATQIIRLCWRGLKMTGLMPPPGGQKSLRSTGAKRKGSLLLGHSGKHYQSNEREIYPCDCLLWTSRSFDVLGGPLNDRFIRFVRHLLAGGRNCFGPSIASLNWGGLVWNFYLTSGLSSFSMIDGAISRHRVGLGRANSVAETSASALGVAMFNRNAL